MANPIPFKWERLDDQTYRAKVFGGWIVENLDGDSGVGLVFVPDPNHEWEVADA